MAKALPPIAGGAGGSASLPYPPPSTLPPDLPPPPGRLPPQRPQPGLPLRPPAMHTYACVCSTDACITSHQRHVACSPSVLQTCNMCHSIRTAFIVSMIIGICLSGGAGEEVAAPILAHFSANGVSSTQASSSAQMTVTPACVSSKQCLASRQTGSSRKSFPVADCLATCRVLTVGVRTGPGAQTLLQLLSLRNHVGMLATPNCLLHTYLLDMSATCCCAHIRSRKVLARQLGCAAWQESVNSAAAGSNCLCSCLPGAMLASCLGARCMAV